MMKTLGKMNNIYYVGILCLILSLASCAAPVDISNQKGYVNDFAGVLKDKTILELTLLSEEINNKAGVETVIMTMKEVEDTLENFSGKIFKEWNIGAKEPGKNGILILIDVKSKQAYIRNSASLDNLITPDVKKVIVNILMKRFLEESDFNMATGACLVQLAKILRDGMGVDIRPVYHEVK